MTIRMRTWILALLGVAAVAGVFQPLAAQGKNKKSNKPAPATAGPLVWPLPPEPTRVRYLTTYRGADDFKTKKPGRWKSMLLGNEDPALQKSDVMLKPYGMAVSPTGQLFVADTAARRVFVFDADLKTVGFVGEKAPAKLTKPVGVAVDDDANVYVADASANRVFVYNRAGDATMAIGGEGELASPSGLAFDRETKRLYVADSSKHQVVSYSIVDGARLNTLGKRGGADGEFNFPTNLFVDRQSRLYVADTLNFRVQVFDSDGRFLKAFGTQGDTAGTFNRPKGIGVDSEGHIYVADTSFNNFQIFDDAGQLLLFVGSGGGNAGEFLLPSGLYIDARDRIYVADQGNSRVQVFQYVRNPTR
jgi:DNA-binding beta-propeller fold protein YncE